ncbi:MAG: hypothetical protein HN472_10365 [Nitrospina sp.]|jgi:hypothetical protein|nr:hypothetical protein [Nitrospina sp.]MBT3874439.1 hypothetical protein [Nitrospina sp.]MBT4049071.1 hypothetical protein [Nitrospina sp.]MBT4559109.1 hypothetical protein [Nitrospina sp.]MBT5347775.1 hypothetical protein [Nitrospina sp.]
METDSNSPTTKKSLTSHLALFTAKVTIVLFLFLGFGSIAIILSGNIFASLSARVINKIESISPEDVETYKLKIRRAGQKYQPLLKEIISAWDSAKKDRKFISELEDEESQ